MVKFPLAYDPFPGFELSPEKRAEVEQYADSIVRKHVDEYMTFVHHQKRVLDRRLWKEVKTKENVTVYKQRGSSDRAVGSEFTMPKLLAVGSAAGSLDDAMYGGSVPDLDKQRIVTSYLNDEVVDCRVLCPIRNASEEDPYRFLAIRWLAKGHDPVIGMVVRPRDLIILDSMGICKTSTGESIGYHLVHSLELPQCPELTHLNIVRSKVSACYLFKEVEPKRKIEVFVSMLVSSGGNVPDSIAALTVSNTFIQASRFAWCGQLKKLAWLTAEAARQRRITSDSDGARAHSTRCTSCDKSFGSSFRSPIACALCNQLTCSNCRTTKRLSFLSSSSRSVVKEDTAFCVGCLVRAKRVSSRDVALYEHIPGALAQRDVPLLNAGGWTIGEHEYSSSSSGSIAKETMNQWEAQFRLLPSTSSTRPSTRQSTSVLSEMSNFDDDYEHDDEEPYTPRGQNESYYGPPLGGSGYTSPAYPPTQPEYQHLWMQMNQLRLQAEQAYETTRSNTRVMLETTHTRSI